MKGVFPLLTVYFLKGVAAGKFKRGLRMSFLRFIVTPLSHYASYSSEGKKKMQSTRVNCDSHVITIVIAFLQCNAPWVRNFSRPV